MHENGRTKMFDADAVRRNLDYPGCIDAMRKAMIALSEGRTRQLLRSIIQLGDKRVFALMPAALAIDGMFGAKLVSVFSDSANPGRSKHRGFVVMFEPDQGHPVCIADAEEVTLIRTAAMSAAATDVLARPDSSVLTIYGGGAQCAEHVEAISLIRDLKEVRIWGRDINKTSKTAAMLASKCKLAVRAIADGREAARDADIICTVTGSSEPIIFGDWLSPGTHVNLVGSSVPGKVEVERALVMSSRYIADSRVSIIAQGAEFLEAKEAGAIDDDHIVAEIGEVLSGKVPGRLTPHDITAFKSIGHAVQDIAAVAYLYQEHR